MKATLLNGAVLEGTPKEIANAMHRLNGHATSQSDASHPIQAAAQNLGGFFWKEEQVRALWNCLDGDQNKLLRFLLDRKRASIGQLKTHLGKDKGNGVAGILANISRNARRETDFKKATVIRKVRGEDGKKYYHIAPDVLPMLEQLV
jgi:hypothetical protein